MTLSFYSDDAGGPLLTCCACRTTDNAAYGFAHPVRLYRQSLSCRECGIEFCDWELGDHEHVGELMEVEYAG